jgi:hypothetical protein
MFMANDSLLVSCAGGRCVDKQLCLAGLVERQEPEGGFVDSLADCKDAVVLQDRCFTIA